MCKNLVLMALMAILGLSSCKKEESDPSFCDLDWDTETEAEYDALVNAYNVYVNDLSAANCIAYKTAFGNYVEALKPFLECESWSDADLQELQGVIDEAEASMNMLDC